LINVPATAKVGCCLRLSAGSTDYCNGCWPYLRCIFGVALWDINDGPYCGWECACLNRSGRDTMGHGRLKGIGWNSRLLQSVASKILFYPLHCPLRWPQCTGFSQQRCTSLGMACQVQCTAGPKRLGPQGEAESVQVTCTVSYSYSLTCELPLPAAATCTCNWPQTHTCNWHLTKHVDVAKIEN